MQPVPKKFFPGKSQESLFGKLDKYTLNLPLEVWIILIMWTTVFNLSFHQRRYPPRPSTRLFIISGHYILYKFKNCADDCSFHANSQTTSHFSTSDSDITMRIYRGRSLKASGMGSENYFEVQCPYDSSFRSLFFEKSWEKNIVSFSLVEVIVPENHK